MRDDTTPAEAIALSRIADIVPCTLDDTQRERLTDVVAQVAARAAATQLQRDIQLATEYNARYVVYECPQSTRVGRVPVEYPFADLLAAQETL